MGETGNVHPPAAGRQRAPAKLTLSLRVLGTRADGYHLLDAEMVTLELADSLEFSPGSGIEVLGPASGRISKGEDNLVAKALRAVDRRAHVRLHKRIPAGAGLGGGSADAAAVLRWAGCHDVAVAAALGMDVPFCLVGGRARVTGAGEVLEPMPVEDRAFTLLVPPLTVSTAQVYRVWDALGSPRGEQGNDLEPAAIVAVPALCRYRDALGDATGLTPRLAGSGGTWFVEGEFPGDDRLVVRTESAAAGR